MTQDPRKLAAEALRAWKSAAEYSRSYLFIEDSQERIAKTWQQAEELGDKALAALDAAPERDVAERVREVLRSHWLTEIRCDHENKTDQAFCSCSEWGGEPQNSVRLAVDDWINHVLEQMK